MSTNPVKKLAMALSLGLVAAGGLAATPAAARDHYHDYRPGDYYRGHDYRGYRHYDRNYYRGERHKYRDARYYRGDRHSYRCRDNGTGGAIIGAIAGGLLGNEVTHRGDKTTGTVVGAAIGAIAGHAIDKGNGRC